MKLHRVITLTMILAALPKPLDAQNVQNQSDTSCRTGNLNHESPATIKAVSLFLDELKTAIRKSDKQRVAKIVFYPLSVATPTAETTVKSEEEFAKRYDEVFPQALRSLLLKQRPGCVGRVGAKGFTIGTGEIWFDLYPDGKVRIFSINPVETPAGLGNAIDQNAARSKIEDTYGQLAHLGWTWRVAHRSSPRRNSGAAPLCGFCKGCGF